MIMRMRTSVKPESVVWRFRLVVDVVVALAVANARWARLYQLFLVASVPRVHRRRKVIARGYSIQILPWEQQSDSQVSTNPGQPTSISNIAISS